MPLPAWRTPAAWCDARGPRPLVMLTTSYPAPDAPLSGPFVQTLAARLAAEGHHVEVLTPATARTGAASGREGGVLVRRLASLGHAHAPFHQGGLPELLEAPALAPLLALPPALIHLAIAAVRALRPLGPRAIALGHWLVPGALLAAAAARVADTDACAVCHSAGVRLVHRLPRPIGRPLAAFALGTLPPVITSHSLHALLEEIIGHPIAAHIAPMPTPPTRPAAPDAPPPLRLLFLGRLVPIKNLGALIDALVGIDGVELHVAGEGPMREAWTAQARARGVAATFHGVVLGAAKERLLASCHALVLPSTTLPNGRAEGAPVAVLEALASGLPVLATATGGLPELLAGVEGATLCAPDALASALPGFLAGAAARWSAPR